MTSFCGFRQVVTLLYLVAAGLFTGCGGGSSSGSGGSQDFSISILPSQASVGQAGVSAPVNVTVNGINGFAGSVSVNMQTLPAGVGTIPQLPFAVVPGTPQTVLFTATDAAALGTANVQLVGTGADLQRTTNFSVQVTDPIVSPPPALRTSFGNLDAAPFNFGNSMAVAKLIVYDGARQQIFVSNTLLNEVDVFSTVSRQRIATIVVPDPFGIDISADGNTIYVGTFTDFVYMLDPQKLAVTGRVSFAAPLQTGQYVTVNAPLAVAALSNGNVMLLMGTGDGAGAGAAVVIWDPITNQIVETIPTGYPAIGPMARSGDHSKAAFAYQAGGNNGTNVTLYDVATDQTVNGSYNGAIPYSLALNNNGSEIVIGGGLQLQTYDSQLNPLKQVPLSLSSMGVLFSTDGTTIYHSSAGIRIDVYNSNTLTLIGQFSDIGLEGIGGSLLGDVDSTGIVYALNDHGVAFLDASQPTTSTDNYWGLDFAAPQAGPLGAPTPLSFGAGATAPTPAVSVGGQPGWNVSSIPFQQGEKIYLTAPPSDTPGPANVFIQWPDGWSWLEAEDFSYGPWARYVFETGGPSQGGAPIALAGYGYGWNLGSPQILYGSGSAAIGSIAAVSNYIEPYPYQQLQVTLMTSPPGVPGPADLTITTPVGTTTVPHAFHYMKLVTPVSLNPNNLVKAVWDESRNQVYLSNGSQIAVFSTSTQQFLAPIMIPNATASTQLAELAITPDNNTLLVADYGDSAVLVIDLNGTASVQWVSTVVPSTLQSGGTTNPLSVAATNTGKAFVTVPNQSVSPPQPNSFLEIDLNTLQLITRADAPAVDNTATIRAALGGGELLIQDHGTAQLYSSVSDTFGGIKGLGLGGDLDGAVSADGNEVVIGEAFADGELNGSGFFAYIDLFTLDAVQQYGEKWHPTGSLLYVPIDHGFDILDGNTGKLRERVSLPVAISSGAPPGPLGSVDTLLIDSTGENLIMLTTTGVVFVQLDGVPIGIGSLTPSFGSAGTALTLRGSGFTNATTAAFNGTPASVTYVDANTLNVVAPSGPSGAARVSVANTNGESYYLDAAFNYGSAPTTKSARGASNHSKPLHPSRSLPVDPRLSPLPGRRLFYDTQDRIQN
jgi:hypothetical protein